MKKPIEILQGSIDRVGLVHGRGDGFQGFIAVAGDADYDGFIAWNAPGLDATQLRGMAAVFKQAIAHGAVGEAKAAAETMRDESGSRLIPKKPR